jgi:predicted nucleic acid-binding protein
MALTVLDAGVVIAVLDATDAHHSAARAALREALDRGDDLVLPASAYAECLVGPLRRGPEAAGTVDGFIEALPARVEPITRSIARAASALRAQHGRALRFPDALVLATALELRAHRLLTTDAGWPTLDVPVVVIGDVLVGILPRPPGGTDTTIRELRGPGPDDGGSGSTSQDRPKGFLP